MFSEAQFNRELDGFLRHHMAGGRVRRWRADPCDYDLSFRLDIELFDGQRLGYRIHEDELRMGGIEALRYWEQRIDHDIRRYFEQAGLRGLEPPRRHDSLFGWTAIRPEFIGIDWAHNENPEAAQKAKDLFRLICGEKAFKLLLANKPLPLIGSKGTKYTLHNRATYCVERTKDGAKLCAVVPGVPLFDHLLGIKLMVEHDEPLFLKTANVSNG